MADYGLLLVQFLNARLRVLARHIFVLPDVHRVAAASQRELVERALVCGRFPSWAAPLPWHRPSPHEALAEYWALRTDPPHLQRIVDGQDGQAYYAYYAVDPAFLMTNKDAKRGMNKALYSHRSGVMTALSKVEDHTPTRQLVEGALTARVPDAEKLITQDSIDKVMSWVRSIPISLASRSTY